MKTEALSHTANSVMASGYDSSPNPGSPALSTTSSGSGTSGRSEPPKRLRYWLIDMINSGDIPGLYWKDEAHTIFRIPWKHAGKNNWKQEDCRIFKAWAEHRGKYKKGDKPDAATWKTRLRCALNKLPDIKELKEQSFLEGNDPYRVYQLLPEPDKMQEYEIYPRNTWGKESPIAVINHSPTNADAYMLQQQDITMLSSAGLPVSHRNIIHDDVAVSHLALSRPPIDPTAQFSQMTVYDEAMPVQDCYTINKLDIAPPQQFGAIATSVPTMTSSTNDGYVQNMAPHQPSHTNPSTGLASPTGSDTSAATLNIDADFGNLYENGGLDMSQPPTLTALQPPDTAPQPHEMEIYIRYRGFTVSSCIVTELTGCRIHYGDASMQRFAAAAQELPSSIFGSESLKQISLLDCEPYAVSHKQVMLTKHVLNNIKRGLILFYEDGCFYAKRLCQSRVFIFGPESTGNTPEKLDRNTKVKVFDYRKFCTNLRRFAAEGRSKPPETELKASFGQNWSIKTPIEKNLVTLYMVPRAAKFLLHKVREKNNTFESINDSISECGPDSYDRLADQATYFINEMMQEMNNTDQSASVLQSTQVPMSASQNIPFQSGFFQQNIIHPAPIAPPQMDVDMCTMMQ